MTDGWAFLYDNIEFIYYDDDQYAPHEFGGGWGGDWCICYPKEQDWAAEVIRRREYQRDSSSSSDEDHEVPHIIFLDVKYHCVEYEPRVAIITCGKSGGQVDKYKMTLTKL